MRHSESRADNARRLQAGWPLTSSASRPVHVEIAAHHKTTQLGATKLDRLAGCLAGSLLATRRLGASPRAHRSTGAAPRNARRHVWCAQGAQASIATASFDARLQFAKPSRRHVPTPRPCCQPVSYGRELVGRHSYPRDRLATCARQGKHPPRHLLPGGYTNAN